ncbi:MAG: hypothetical protein FRX49_01163 [Trebouxia sp. A1-2]|nr:MAG: hypothetical protein FRX49_01163 [Trebouxia sp. A1-2]
MQTSDSAFLMASLRPLVGEHSSGTGFRLGLEVPVSDLEWITPQPSRRPDPVPDFEKLDTPKIRPLPGDPEQPDEEEEEEEEKKKKEKEDPDKDKPDPSQDPPE